MSNSALMCNPARVFVLPIKLTMTARLKSGRPRQFSVIWQNMRCSILFHLLVPGGKWHTEMRSDKLSASFCKHTFHDRARLLLLPPPSAVIRSSVALGYASRPIRAHQRWIVAVANSAVL